MSQPSSRKVLLMLRAACRMVGWGTGSYLMLAVWVKVVFVFVEREGVLGSASVVATTFLFFALTET